MEKLDLYYEFVKSGVRKQTRDEMGHLIAEFVQDKTRSRDLPNLASDYLFRKKSIYVLNELAFDGMSMFTEVATKEAIDGFREFLKSNARSYFTDDSGKKYEHDCYAGQTIPEYARYRHYDVRDMLATPFVVGLCNSFELVKIASAYLGAPATLSDIACWESFPTQLGEAGAQVFHQDRGDFRSLNLFIYLSDVSYEHGPHEFYRGTHRFSNLKALADRLPIEDREKFLSHIDSHRYDGSILERYLLPPSVMVGQRGTGFLEDTNGIHRGRPPSGGVRTCFQLVYTLVKQRNTLNGISRCSLQSKKKIHRALVYANRYVYEYI